MCQGRSTLQMVASVGDDINCRTEVALPMGRFGPIPFRSGRFGPILEVGRFGPILVGRFGPRYFI